MKRGIRFLAMLAAVVLTAKLGRIEYNGHYETWYDLNMTNVIIRAHNNGMYGDYWIDEQGLKRFDDYVIVAANWNVHPYGSLVETSRGIGIVLDTGDFTKDEPYTIDLATAWK